MAPTPGLSVTILVAVPVQGKQTACVGWCRDPQPSAGEDPRRRVWPGRESCKQEGGGSRRVAGALRSRQNPGFLSANPTASHRDLLPRFPEGPLTFSRFVCKMSVYSFTIGPTRSPATRIHQAQGPAAMAVRSFHPSPKVCSQRTSCPCPAPHLVTSLFYPPPNTCLCHRAVCTL